MNKTRRLVGLTGIALCGVLPSFTTHGQPSAIEVNVGLPSLEIRAESDFYEPLTPYGRWQVVGAYGRCWIPGHVETDWRPYCEGYWLLTDAGWYWVSEEPWAWATYHYGRWDLSDQFGWYWVPQTQWSPAWVSWHSGGGYIGWAPMYPPGARVISPRAYVFVEERHFMEPVRRSKLVANSTTIINKTIIKEAPVRVAVEKATASKLQAVPAQELRHKSEAAVVSKQRMTPATTIPKKASPQVPAEAPPVEKKAAVAHVPPQVDKPATAPHEPSAPAPKSGKAPGDILKPAPAATEPKLAAKPEARRQPEAKPAAKSAPKIEATLPAATREPAGEKPSQPAEKPKMPSSPPSL